MMLFQNYDHVQVQENNTILFRSLTNIYSPTRFLTSYLLMQILEYVCLLVFLSLDYTAKYVCEI